MLSDDIPILVPNRWPERLIHLADDMTSTSIPNPGERPLTVYLTTWERMVASEFPNRYPFLWKEGLAFDENGNVTPIQDITSADQSLRWIESYAYWQPTVSNEICRDIQAIINPDSREKPEYFVKNFVNKVLVPTTIFDFCKVLYWYIKLLDSRAKFFIASPHNGKSQKP